MNAGTSKTGKVYLVGAGPGDPGMITLRGVECLRRADLVLFDYLVNPEVLHHARTGAELICLGRHGRDRIWSQARINERMIRAAHAGRTVVRLKGGDPAVFARGAEETEALVAEQILFEIVPGITVALAAGSCAGLSITHRDLASAVALVTGQQQSGSQTELDYSALAQFPGTLVFHMGVTTAPAWTAGLIEAGKPAVTPAAIIRRCSLPDQMTIRCTLGEVAERMMKPDRLRPPVIVIIGPVATLPSTLSWFEHRALFGTTVLVTRPYEQVAELREPFVELGAEVLVQPAIQIGPPADWGPVDKALARLDQFDWVVFSSSNGVRGLLNRLLDTGGDLRKLGGVQLAAVGPGTKRELGRFHLSADVLPQPYHAEALAETLARDASGRRFLLVRASRGREVLARQLAAAGADVEQIVVYESSDVSAPDENIAHRVADGDVDWITVTSSAIASSLVAMFGESLKKSRLASISPVTSSTLRQLGYEPAVEADEYTMPGVVEAVVRCCDLNDARCSTEGD